VLEKGSGEESVEMQVRFSVVDTPAHINAEGSTYEQTTRPTLPKYEAGK